MTNLITCSWLFLALLHLPPALVLLNPRLIDRLYGVSPDGDLGLLLMHRGVLFLIIVAISIYALFQVDSRTLVATVVAGSVIGFLLLYLKAGVPQGKLAKIALADLVALVPLFLVCKDAWFGGFES